MDVCEPQQALQKQSTTLRTTRRPLVPADNKDGVHSRARTQQVNSRCRSPVPSAAACPKRCPSPNASRLSSTSNLSAPKRATSIERKRLSRPSSPQPPSTPIQDTTAEVLLGSRKVASNGLPESLWPSTMRSLSASFQSDIISVPIGKKEKPASHVPLDRTVKVSSNAAQRQAGISASRKPTPERKRSPLKGKNSSDQLENSKPTNSFPHPRIVDQHRWPSRNGKLSTSLNRSIDLADRTSNSSSISGSETGTPSLRKLTLVGSSKPLQKSSSDLLMQISRDENGKAVLGGSSVDCSSPRMQKSGSTSSSDRTKLANAAARAMSLPTPGSRPSSPLSHRGPSPSRIKGVNNPPSRGLSPSRARPSSPSRQPQNSTSVLSFIADIRRGKKSANHIEDVHQLRLLYNRHLQWRYANARSAAVVQTRKVKSEKMLYGILRAIADLWDSITEKRIDIQQLKLKLNLYSVLNNQLSYLDKWASAEMDHLNSLTRAIQDLHSSTIRIPFTGGARGDVQTVKAAICSAVDVMQAVRSSLCSTFSRVEGMNSLLSELADVAAHERAMLNECEYVLSSTAALQGEEYSGRAQLLQTMQGWREREGSLRVY